MSYVILAMNVTRRMFALIMVCRVGQVVCGVCEVV